MIKLTIEQYKNGVKFVVLYSTFQLDDRLQVVDETSLSNLKCDPFISSLKIYGYVVWDNTQRYIQCSNIKDYLDLMRRMNDSYQ